MRIVLALVALLVTDTAFAQSWPYYDNARFGFEIDIPPGFSGQGELSEGIGQDFIGPGSSHIAVWGGPLIGTFDDLVAFMQSGTPRDWLSLEQVSTAHWANISAAKGSRRAFQRVIELCDTQSFAAFRAEYDQSQVGDMQPIIERMASSLQSTHC